MGVAMQLLPERSNPYTPVAPFWLRVKCHNSTEDSSDSYRLNSRRNVFRGHEVLPTSGSPTVAPYKQPSLPQPEEATPTVVVKPLSPPRRSPPPEDNKHVTPYSLGGYPLGSDAQGAYDNAQDEDHTEEEEMHGGCNNVACIVLIVWVGLCIIITILLASASLDTSEAVGRCIPAGTASFKVSCLILLYLNSWQLQDHRQPYLRPV
ncbi:hypothetical protein HPB51_008753 [Rhipicephalus microplus]|uniref:Uncharacterized protein n=1 Tax=Rhipicephalus microplus TaxID=6941 RepID=A0A9J6EFY6_RHIMP|nr:hypothetical protein HPB51_008753 [Rhipicephalus microplus]